MFNFAIKERSDGHSNVTAKKFGEKLNQSTQNVSNVQNSTKKTNEPSLLIDFGSSEPKTMTQPQNQNQVENKTNTFDILTLDFGNNQPTKQNLIQDKEINNMNIFSNEGNTNQNQNNNWNQNFSSGQNTYMGQINYPQFENNQFSKNNNQNVKQQQTQERNPLDDLFG